MIPFSKQFAHCVRRGFRAAATLLFWLVMSGAQPAAAQDDRRFPVRAVTICVPFPPGGATDLTARLVAQGLSKKWNQSVLVDSRAGVGGSLGSELVARTMPDGYTLLLGVTSSHGINPSLYKNMRYHPLKDFDPLTQAMPYPKAVVVNSSVPANNLRELLSLAKAKPGSLTYGSDGNSSASHLGMEMLQHQGQVDFRRVPYGGGAPMLTDLLGGQLQVGITGLPAVQPYVKSGRLKLMAVATARRLASAPDYPTVAEQGFPGYATAAWSGFLASKGAPKALVEKISADIRLVMQDEQVEQRLLAAGGESAPSNPTQFRDFLRSEIDKWAESVRISGATVG